jgi:hypothetical protein
MILEKYRYKSLFVFFIHNQGCSFVELNVSKSVVIEKAFSVFIDTSAISCIVVEYVYNLLRLSIFAQ